MHGLSSSNVYYNGLRLTILRLSILRLHRLHDGLHYRLGWGLRSSGSLFLAAAVAANDNQDDDEDNTANNSTNNGAIDISYGTNSGEGAKLVKCVVESCISCAESCIS
jgi:hypothetical protein